MQIVMKKCFLLKPEKKLYRSVFVFEQNTKKYTLIPKNDVTETKAKLLE